MEVTEEIFNWLKQSNSLKHPVSNTNNKLSLSEADTSAFDFGINFVPLIKRLSKALNPTTRLSTPLFEINSITDTTSTAAKLYN